MVRQQDNKTLGKNFGIAGFILSTIPAGWLAGLIFSIVGYRLSKSAGIRNKLAIAGIWISSIFIGLILIGFLVVTALAYFDTQARDQDMRTNVAVSLVESEARLHYEEQGTYPSFEQLEKSQPFRLLPDGYTEPVLVDDTRPSEDEIGYVGCIQDGDITGAKLYIYSRSDRQAKLASTLGDC